MGGLLHAGRKLDVEIYALQSARTPVLISRLIPVKIPRHGILHPHDSTMAKLTDEYAFCRA